MSPRFRLPDGDGQPTYPASSEPCEKPKVSWARLTLPTGSWRVRVEPG